MSPAAAGLLGSGFDLALSEERDFLSGDLSLARPRARAVEEESPSLPLAWALPGRGVSCGRDPKHLALRYRICPGNHAVPYVDSCDRRDCPTCWRVGWLRREAGRMLTVLQAESKARASLGKHRRVVHVSVNPPPVLWGSVEDPARHYRVFRLLRARAYRVARRAGIVCGAVVFHRRRCADKWDPIETDGPHFHVLGFGWIADGSVTFKRTGWVVRNHGLKVGEKAVRGEATYLLSHSARLECGGISQWGKSGGATLTVTWFGRRVRARDIPTDGVFCPLCGVCYPKTEWVSAEWVGEGPPPVEPVTVDWSAWRAVAFDSTGTFGGGSRRILYLPAGRGGT